MERQGLVIDYCYPATDETKLDLPLIAIIVLGLDNLLLGLFELVRHFDLVQYDQWSASLPVYLLSGIVLILSCHSLRRRIITESMMMILSALVLVLHVTSSLQDSTDLGSTVLLFILGFFACAVIFRYRGEVFYSSISINFALVLLSGVLLQRTGFAYVADILMTLNGAGLAVYAGCNVAGYKTHLPLVPSYSVPSEVERYPEMLVSSVGALMFAILSFSVGVEMAGGSGPMYSFLSFKMFMSLIVLAFGMYGVYHRIIGEGLIMALVGIASVINAVGMLGFGEAPHYLDLLFGCLLLPVSVVLLSRRSYLLGTTALLMALVLLIEHYWEGSELLEAVTIAFKAVSTTFALITWYEYDLGAKPRFVIALQRKLGELF